MRVGLTEAAHLLPIAADEQTVTAVLSFINGRLAGVLREQGHTMSVVRAVLAELTHNPYQATQTAVALSKVTQAEDWDRLLDSYARCARIVRQQKEPFVLHPDAFALPQEKVLLAAYEAAQKANDNTVATFVTSLRQLEPAITQFFDDVLVMDEETAVRENRLALLQHITALTKGIADLSELEGF